MSNELNTEDIELSVVILLYNEAESLPELISWVARVCNAHFKNYEIILIDDGSRDDSWEVLHNLKRNYPKIFAYKFRRNYGKSAALNVGFRKSSGKVVITMDADLQDSPDEIPKLYQMIVDNNFDMVSGWKKKRYDPISKTLPSKIFNWVTRFVTGIKLNDFNCGLKAYRNEVIKSIEVYGEMHRYIPFLVKSAGFDRIGEKVVEHRARKYGKSKFGLERFMNGFLDLLSITFILKFGRKPMHFFGTLGALSFIVGFLITVLLLGEKLYKLYHGIPLSKIRPVVEQPLFFLSLVSLVAGLQMFLTGFLGELIVRNSNDKSSVLIADSIT